jgi:hypothetical protein
MIICVYLVRQYVKWPDCNNIYLFSLNKKLYIKRRSSTKLVSLAETKLSIEKKAND